MGFWQFFFSWPQVRVNTECHRGHLHPSDSQWSVWHAVFWEITTKKVALAMTMSPQIPLLKLSVSNWRVCVCEVCDGQHLP